MRAAKKRRGMRSGAFGDAVSPQEKKTISISKDHFEVYLERNFNCQNYVFFNNFTGGSSMYSGWSQILENNP